MDKLEDRHGHQNKSAKTVMKRNHGPGMFTPAKIFDFASDPVNLGIRPSTAIQLKQIETIVGFNKSLPASKQKNALPMIMSNNVGSISRTEKNKKG